MRRALVVVDLRCPRGEAPTIFLASMDRPLIGEAHDVAAVPIAGWVLPKTGDILAMEVLSEPSVIARLLPVPRPDVERAYPRIGAGRQPGFATKLMLTAVHRELELKIRAVFKNQARTDICSIVLQPVPIEADLVSVVIPCYNHAHHLREAIQSVLQQTYANVQLIVVDDGSVDNTREVAHHYPGIEYLVQENRGLGAARNAGLAECEGEFVLFLDADDRLLPDALASGVEALRKSPESALAVGRHARVTSQGDLMWLSSEHGSEEIGFASLLERNVIAMHGSVLYRRSVVQSMGEFSTFRRLSGTEDYDLYLRIARNHRICAHGTVMAEYRQHGSNMSHDARRMLAGSVNALRRQRAAGGLTASERAALSDGLGYWREWYGRRLVQSLAQDARGGHWRQVASSVAHLARFDPSRTGSALRTLFVANRLGSGRPNRPDRSLRSRQRPPSPLEHAPGAGAGRGAQGLVLLYHSLASAAHDPWSLCVSPRHFEEHLQVLQDLAVPRSLRELRQDLVSGEMPQGSVCLTFDDGYADNLFVGVPALERHEIPATVFVASGFVGPAQPFWWDWLAEVLLSEDTPLPEEVLRRLGGEDERVIESAEIGEEPRPTRRWRGWEAPTARRQMHFRRLWDILRAAPIHQRDALLAELRQAFDNNLPEFDRRSLSAAELAQLSSSELIEVGGHTVNHPALALLGSAAQEDEISGCKRMLENLSGGKVEAFAYPYGGAGDLTGETVELVRRCGFQLACRAEPGAVISGSDPLQIPRMVVEDWDGDEFAKHLAGWLTHGESDFRSASSSMRPTSSDQPRKQSCR